jgi:hypothetical protein
MMPRLVTMPRCLGMSPIIPIDGAIILWSVGLEFPTDGGVVSREELC